MPGLVAVDVVEVAVVAVAEEVVAVGVAARPPRAAQAQVSQPTRADRRDDGALVVTRAAHGRLRHQVAADRAEVETAA